MDVSSLWVSHPHEWQPLFRRWSEEYAKQTALHAWRQLGGQEVLGLTINPVPSNALSLRPFRLLVTVPHAHEPACTAAIVDTVSQLLVGVHLDGSPSSLPRKEILAQSTITFMPDTNSQGRCRSPQRFWDGLTYDNDEFLKYAFGIATDGERFGRYPLWRYAEHNPQRIGVVYEEVAEGVWVEPNTSRNSTHCIAVDALYAQYRYTHMLEMHQHEYDEAALLPGDFDQQAEDVQQAILQWADAVIDAWQEAGSKASPEPRVPYKGQPRQQFFVEFWEGRCPGMLRLSTEVRNNRHARTGEPTPILHQFQMASAALRATLCRSIEGFPGR